MNTFNIKTLIFIAISALFPLVATAQVTDRDINESALLNAQFTRYQVWDAKRFPAYPTVGRNWELSKLKSPIDITTKFMIDWGAGFDRYLMFELEADNYRRESSLIDDVNNSRTRYVVTLNLFEKDGRFVKKISRWGKLIGFGSGGFMYEQEGDLGTFFSAGNASYGATIVYRPELAQLVYLSEIVRDKDRRNNRNDRDNRYQNDRNTGNYGNTGSYGNTGNDRNTGNYGNDRNDRNYNNSRENEVTFLTATYSRSQVWDAQRTPGSPVVGRDWMLSFLKAPYDVNTSKALYWGRNFDYFLMFELEENNSSTAYTLIDDIDNSRRRYAVALKLFDRDGRYIKTVSRWGRLMGFGSGGFMYEQEGIYGTFFTGERTGEGKTVIYRPEVAQIKYLSEIVNDAAFMRHSSNPEYRPNVGYRQNAGYRPQNTNRSVNNPYRGDSPSSGYNNPSNRNNPVYNNNTPAVGTKTTVDPKAKTDSGSVYRRPTR